MNPTATLRPTDQGPTRLPRPPRLASGRFTLVCLTLLLVGAVAALASLAWGSGNPVPARQVLAALVGRADPSTTWVLTTLRLPRVLAAGLVGAALAVSGAILQSSTRNVLASPDIIGFTAGAATGGLLTILVFDGGPALIAVGAMVGGLGTAALVLRVAGQGRGNLLVLVGVGVGALLTATNSFLITRAELGQALSAAVWLTGSLNVRTWSYVVPLAAALLVLTPVLVLLARPMRLLELGDDTASALGVPTARTRRALVVCAVALMGAAVSVAGPIGFVALAAPQIGRRLVAAPGMVLLPAALVGAVLLIVSDLIAMRLFAPAQLPVGVVTAAVGGCYLVWLLAREWRRGHG